MEQSESTKNENEQPQSQELPEPEQPKAVQSDIEPARTCKICGGPNHHGCGCEARVKKIDQETFTEPAPAITAVMDEMIARCRTEDVQILIGLVARTEDMVELLKSIDKNIEAIKKINEVQINGKGNGN